MDNALSVRIIQRAGDLPEQIGNIAQRQLSTLEDVFQRTTIQIAHHDIRRHIRPVKVVYWQDVDMLQPGNQARFPLETLHAQRITGQIFLDYLDRYDAIYTGL